MTDIEQERENISAIPVGNSENIFSSVVQTLGSYIETLWGEAQKAKDSVSDRMIAALNQKNGIYDSEKLAAIKEVNAPEVFTMITDTKYRTAKAWLDEIIVQQGRKIWSIEPTPIPDLPKHIEDRVNREIIERSMMMIQKFQIETGQQMTNAEMQSLMEKAKEWVVDNVKDNLARESKHMADKMGDKIHDQLTEGGFYESLASGIDDILLFPAAFIKGPIYRKEKIKKVDINTTTNVLEKRIEERIIPTYERRSPFSIYPAPYSTTIDDGYLFDVIDLTRKQLYSLIGLPGFDEEAIRAVLQEYDTGSLNNWLNIEADVKDSTGIPYENQSMKNEKIQCLEFWGTIPGRMLIEWGLDESLVPDPDDEYDACCYKIGTHVIKAALNEDAFGKKPFYKCSFEDIPDSFWGQAMVECIKDVQQICNATVRAIVANVAIASGPQIERNIDRIPSGQSADIVPWKTWDVTDEQMSSAPALKFYQPQSVASELASIFTLFSKVADTHSGIPAFAHGDPYIGGGGDTASGMSMLIAQASRGIKDIVKSIDIDWIAPVVQTQYEYNIEEEDLYSLVGDFRVVAKGYSALQGREAQVTRKIEMLNAVNNPTDMQILGPEGRKFQLRDVFGSLEMDVDQILPEDMPMPNVQLPVQQGAPQPNPQTLDAAGAPVVGQDTRQFNPQNTPGQVSTPGNPGSALDRR